MTGPTADIVRLNYVGIVSPDAERSVAWYCEKLGFERFYDFVLPGMKTYFVRLGDLCLEFFQVESAAPMDADRQ